MSTTATLEDNYTARPVQVIQRPGVTLYVRTFRVPADSLDSLKPSVGDTFYSDSTQIVIDATPSMRKGALACWLTVTYMKRIAGSAA